MKVKERFSILNKTTHIKYAELSFEESFMSIATTLTSYGIQHWRIN